VSDTKVLFNLFIFSYEEVRFIIDCLPRLY